MEIHYGQILEKVVRRNGHSISDVARLTNVNRRSVYNWFNQQQLKADIIFRVGCVINHDFSIELPHLFTSEDFERGFKRASFSMSIDDSAEDETQHYWKDKYISLLEQYNQQLAHQLSVAV
ncbi:helix-turn-helix domain-containing protein [Arcticibacter sp.]|jgi:hypothetical protein|uniref:helix-turn-helix domain-containing protein n=1 Tax=Arcticibacter sp. TaxID=1872630 RepID=UPI00389043A0